MKFLKFFVSMSFMGLLLVVFGISIAVATFIENDFGTLAAKSVVYNATWFEILLGLMVINMIGVIFVRRLYQKSKIPAFLFHLAFIVIIIGAGITRYWSIEGVIHIREGASSNSFISDKAYVKIEVQNGSSKTQYVEEAMFSILSGNKFNKRFDTDNGPLSLSLQYYIPNAAQVLEEDQGGGQMYITVVTGGSDGRQNRFIKLDETTDLGGMNMSFGDTTSRNDIHVLVDQGDLVFRAPNSIEFITMSTQEQGVLEANQFHRFQMRHLYNVNGVNFVLTNFTPNGKIKLVPNPDKERTSYDAAVFVVSNGMEEEEIVAFGGKGFLGEPAITSIDGNDITISYGSQFIELPFSIRLVDFQLERYPGSESPASFASEVIVEDLERGVNQPFRIFMNNILEYRGYRFYQSSYDQDELGTVLSVNHDYLGSMITYLGYFILAAGLVSVLFSKNTRFAFANKRIKEIHRKRKSMAAIISIMTFFTVSGIAAEADEVTRNVVDPEHASKFGKLLYQKNDGRIIPLNTLANELIRKVTKKSGWDGLSAEQVFLGMVYEPEYWQGIPMIKVSNAQVKDILGISGNFARFIDFFDTNGNYRLKSYVDEVFAKNPSQRSKFDKEVIAVDERANICFLTYQGNFLKLFPIPNDPNNKWITPFDEIQNMNYEDSLFVRKVFVQYFNMLREASTNGNYQEADFIVTGISNYQKKFGAEVIPSESKVDLEISYNRLYLFKRLFPYYTAVGFILLVILFAELINPKIQLTKTRQILAFLILAGFGVHTIALIMRWYISGHAPWSNGFESMIYIAWAGLLAGIIFRKKSPITLSVTAILAGIILMVAHLSWMDPEITNLVPVLRSYWLTIHVSAITASYGFLGLGALLAFMSLIIMTLKKKRNFERLNLTIQELSYITEMTLTVGLILLTIGNFLGGVWANESWGRYWGWDPKETWALTTIIVYAFILHMRFIPGLKGFFAFNFVSVIGFGSVLMTYFGVNFYLSGLHSYAKGDPLPIPTFVYYAVFIIALLSITAWIKESRFDSQEEVVEEL